MTLVVCVKAVDGIVLAADSRGTVGDPRGLTAISDDMVKVFSLGKCGISLAGASEMGAVLLDELQKHDAQSFGDIDKAVAKVVSVAAERFGEWFKLIPPDHRPPVLITLAGYRPEPKPKAMIYMLNSQMNFAPQLFAAHCMTGVPQYAVYLIHRYYDPSITLQQAEALAEYLISETASQDPKVGGPVHIAEITPTGGYRELARDEVERIAKSNENLNLRLRQFFRGGMA